MLSQQASLVTDNPYLEEGDWIQLEYQGLFLFSEGFKSTQVGMKSNNQYPLLSLFIIQHVNQSNKTAKKSIHFNEPIVLIHRLSSKYLSYTPNFANKSQFKLRSILTDHCQFILKPLYKCQTIRGNTVRNKEQCMLSPAISQYATENINLVVGKFQKNTLEKVPIYLKKNQFSSLKIIRKNLEKKSSGEISNLLIYQLGHLEEKKWLCCSRNPTSNILQAGFSSIPNGYNTLLMLQLYYDNPEEELRIKNGDYVSLKFIGAKRYLGFSEIGEIILSQDKTQQTGFILELYSNSKTLDINSLIKIKHAKSEKYLSFSSNRVVVEEFRTFNIFQFNNLAPEDLKSNLFINEVYYGLQQQFQDMTNIKRKRAITSILKEIIKFMYKNKNIYEQFLNLQPIKHFLTSQQQSLFAQIGFITLLKNISLYCFDQYQKKYAESQERKKKAYQNLSNQYNEQEHIYLQVCIIIAGICKNHRENIITFSEHIKVYFQHIGKIKANIELLFHIYAFNSVGLEALENQEFFMKKLNVKAIELLCQFIYRKQFSLQNRTKLIKLFHGSIINERNQKNYAHQQIMLTALYQNRLKGIMLSLSNNQDYELIVSLKDQKQELSNMINDEDRYERQLQLLYEQIDLLITLCSRASKKHVNLFRDIISQEMVKKYLNVRLIPRFKSLFLKILVNIYLSKDLNVNSKASIVITNPKKKGFDQTVPFRKFSNLSTLTNKLLEASVEVEMEDVNENKFKFLTNANSINQIKELVKTIIMARLDKNQIETQVISCLYAVSTFLEVGVCEEKEGEQILKLLAKYLQRNYQEKKELNNDLVQKLLELLNHHLHQKLKIKIHSLFMKIRESYKQGEQRLKYSKKIVSMCNQFMQRELTNIIDPQLFDLLSTIVAYSTLTQSYSIFWKSSKLYHQINKISFYFLEMIKGSIPIESDNSHQILRKTNKIYNSLTESAIDYIYYHDNTIEISSLRKTITQIINEAIELLETHDEEEPINIMAQKIMGQFHFFRIVIELIYQREKDLENPENNELFQSLFKFITFFLKNSDQNFFKNTDNLQKLKVLYRHPDRGQIKLLWDLTCMKIVRNRMNKFVFDSWIMAAKRIPQIQIYIPLGFLKLLENDEAKQFNISNLLIKLILQENSILEQLLPNFNRIEQILSKEADATSNEYLFFYVTLVMKLLLTLLEQAKQNHSALLYAYRRYIPLKSLVKLIEESFVLEFQNQNSKGNIFLMISIKLAKKYLLEMFTSIYLINETMEFQYLIYVAQRIAIRLTIKNSQIISDDYLYKNLLFYNKHTENPERTQFRQAIMSYLNSQDQSQFELTPEHFHKYVNNIYLFVNVYYGFLFNLCEKMIEIKLEREDNTSNNIGSTISIKEVEVFIDNVFKRYKEFINEKLSYSEYVAYWSSYSTSIKSTEQILKKKVGLNFNYQANEEDGVSLLEGQQYFNNKEVNYVLNSFLQNKSKLQKYIYEAMLIVTFNPKVVHINVSHKPIFKENFKAIFQVILTKMKYEHENFRQKCQILCSFIALHSQLPEWQPSLEYEEIFKQVATNQDMNSSYLKYYIFTQCKLLENYFSFQVNNFKRYKKLVFDESQEYLKHFSQFKTKIKAVIETEIKFHDKKMLVDQSIAYFQSKFLNYQTYPRNLNIELVLQWLLMKLKYNLENIDRYYQLILDVIALLKAYVRFINEYDKKYISAEIYKKVELCLKILYRSITGNNVRMLMVLIEQQIWVQINLLLSLNDTLQQNLEEIDMKAYDLIKLSTRVKLENLQGVYVQGVLQLYNNSMSIYGQNGQILPSNEFPLVPIKSFFHQIKYIVALTIKQFKHLPNNIAVQFFSKLDAKYIDYNIMNSYQKYNYFYGTYSIATVYSELNYAGKKEEAIAKSVAIENGVEFTSIKMHMDMLNGRYELANTFRMHRIQINKHEKLQTFINTLQNFFIDLLLLLISVFYSGKKNKRSKGDYTEAITFFVAKLSRIEVMFRDQIYQQDFMIFPECKATRKMKNKFLNKLNFISNQLKRQSILLLMQRFNLSYQNELRFYRNFIKIKAMLFMAKYIQILKIISYLIVIVNNSFLIINQIDVSRDTMTLALPFYILTLINLIDSILILIIFCIKDMPLALKIEKYDLSQGIGYFGRKFNQKSNAKKTLILSLMILSNRRLIYNFLYAVVVALIFLNPIFASILLLDVLAHVPSLKSLLLSIWRPKYQLFLTMVAYIILQYFFSILMYFLFKEQASPYCNHLGGCFSFIFLTTFKSIHGFVGYLFQQNEAGNVNLHVTLFSIFEDIYVILIYQIIVALILAIVIDSFTVARAEKLKQIDNLNHACIVCNIDRSKFNIESKLGFNGHISINHNLFSYIDYKYRVTIKSFDYLSDFQLAVLGDKSSFWIPDGKTRQLQANLYNNGNKTIIETGS